MNQADCSQQMRTGGATTTPGPNQGAVVVNYASSTKQVETDAAGTAACVMGKPLPLDASQESASIPLDPKFPRGKHYARNEKRRKRMQAAAVRRRSEASDSIPVPPPDPSPEAKKERIKQKRDKRRAARRESEATGIGLRPQNRERLIARYTSRGEPVPHHILFPPPDPSVVASTSAQTTRTEKDAAILRLAQALQSLQDKEVRLEALVEKAKARCAIENLDEARKSRNMGEMLPVSMEDISSTTGLKGRRKEGA